MKFANRISALSVLAVFTLNAEPVDAKKWRVNSGSNYNGTTLMGSNFGGTFSYPVFKEIDHAVTWAGVNDLPGDRDTIHVEGSPIVYAECHITKNLVIIGPGYYLGDNPKTSNDQFDAKVSRINFWAGSGGSMVAGINIVANFWTSDGYIEVAADSITH